MIGNDSKIWVEMYTKGTTNDYAKVLAYDVAFGHTPFVELDPLTKAAKGLNPTDRYSRATCG